jgi:hypothetical protein
MEGNGIYDRIGLGGDDGFVVVELGGAEAQFDLFQLHDQLAELSGRHTRDNPDTAAWHEGVCQILESAGLPRPSYKKALDLQRIVFDRVALAGNSPGGAGDAPTPASPASTARPPSN